MGRLDDQCSLQRDWPARAAGLFGNHAYLRSFEKAGKARRIHHFMAAIR
jgi:hypothetical protein